MNNYSPHKKKIAYRRYARIHALLALFVLLLTGKSISGQSLAEATQPTEISQISISVQFDDIPIDQAIIRIGKQAGISFNYNGKLLDRSLRTSYKAENVTLSTVLKNVLPGHVGFRVLESSITLYKKEATQQDFSVSGRVYDGDTDNGLPGVNIRVKGSSTGTTTDQNGRYTIMVPSESDTLMFSFIGYKSRNVPVNGRSNIDIQMQSQAISGNEVVVVGYGTQKESNLTEAASQVDVAQLADRPTASLTKSLQGTLPGLNITNNSGDPASESNINIRGFTSINGGSPLVLIDGVEGDIDEINPQDVESVSVLKDASASAMYGARGAFGVVLVTTKSPGDGKTKVSYSNNFGWQSTTTNTDFVTDPYRAVQLVDQAFQISTGNSYTGYTEKDYRELQRRSEDPSLPDVVVENRNGQDQYIYYGNTDWWDYMFKEYYPTQTHNLSVSGGN